MILALTASSLIAASSATAVTRIPARCTHRTSPLLCSVRFHRDRADQLRHRMGLHHLPYQGLAERYPHRRPRLLHYWRHTHAHALKRYHHYQHQQAVAAASPIGAIEAAFGGAAGEALRVATCESTLNVTATNGQYFGLFQLSEYIRYSRPGVPHAGASTDATLQAQAAAAVYYQDGASWREWSCQP